MSTVTQDTLYQKPVMFQKTVTSDRVDTFGYSELYSTGTHPFVGATAIGLAVHADYSIDITVDGVLRQVTGLSFTAATTWTQLAAAIQAALRIITGRSETVTITNYKLRATSEKAGGAGSGTSMVFAEGTGGGTPLLAAINAVSVGKYVCAVANTAGREGVVYIQVAPEAPTLKDFFFVATCKTSANKMKTGLIYSYSKTTGMVTVADDADTVELANGDLLTIAGVFA